MQSFVQKSLLGTCCVRDTRADFAGEIINEQIQNVMLGGDKYKDEQQSRNEGREQQQEPRLNRGGVIAPGNWRMRRWLPCEKAGKSVPGRMTCKGKDQEVRMLEWLEWGE